MKKPFLQNNGFPITEEKSKPILVNQPFLPPLEEFNEYLKQIWESKWLTNNGRFHQEFEKALAEYLNVPYISLFTNGALALNTAIQALRISGEVITTPFSFVATTHSLHWNSIKPVFVDIDPLTCNIDSSKIEAAISPKTTAILPVHVYGHPCNIDEIQRIADIYGLKVIYDAAHTFGGRYKGNSLAAYGELSILSFHATKVFNTFEGGAIVVHDEKLKKRIDYLKNFGFADEVTVVGPGTNAKMNEVQAAMGLLQLKYIDENIHYRKVLGELYYKLLNDIQGVTYLKPCAGLEYNYSYLPVFIDRTQYSCSRDELYEYLKTKGIYARRYFYPLISDFPTYRGLPSAIESNLTTAKKIAETVLCLPLHTNMTEDDVYRICELISIR